MTSTQLAQSMTSKSCSAPVRGDCLRSVRTVKPQKSARGRAEISGLDLIAGVCLKSVLEDSAFAPEHEGRPRYAT